MQVSVVNELGLFSLAAKCVAHLNAFGAEIEQTSDVQRAIELSCLPGKPYKTPFLDPGVNRFTSSNFFWMALHQDGQVKMVGGARCDDLGEDRVTDFWRQVNAADYGLHDMGHPISWVDPVVDAKLSGRLVYFGDLAVVDGSKGNAELTKCFLILASLAALSKWHPDGIYAFVREDGVLGAVEKGYGFMNVVPRPQLWNYAPKSRGSDEWLVFNRKEDFGSALSYAVSKLRSADGLAETQNKRFGASSYEV
jgi:hypothetical protein